MNQPIASQATPMPVELIATSTMGLEAVVSRELTQLGYDNRISGLGQVAFSADEVAICHANLWLRTAGRVLVRMGTFPATDFGQLFDQTNELPWERWIPSDAAFPVNGRSLKSQLSSVPACQRMVKKAIAERLLQAHRVSQLPESGATYQVEVSMVKDEATLTIDTSGSGLHKRGYRTRVGLAPLRETLAAGLILLSFWRAGRPFLDPFCGTGTIPIEAAMIGRNMAPGLGRRFVAEDWPTLPTTLWSSARQQARERVLPVLEERVIGTDLDPTALDLARYHARLAGVDEDIHFQQRDFHDLLSKREYGCLVTNPPYAERMGTTGEVEQLYRNMPDVLRRLKTWSVFILTAYPDFETLVGQQADRRRKLYNSRIECTYYQFHGPRPADEQGPNHPPEQAASDVVASVSEPPFRAADILPEAAAEPALPPSQTSCKPQAAETPAPQAFGGITAKGMQQAEIFRNRLVKRARHLRRWPQKGITCYRLYERDEPQVPLVVDRYEDCLHIGEYVRPHDRSPAEHADWLDLMARTAADALEIERSKVFLKRRQRQRGTLQHGRVGDENRLFVVQEGGLKFQVNLSDYVDTGLFLDHRITRSMVRQQSQGKRFLNLFGYTGAFTVYAAAGGAATTVTVDLSQTYLRWARQNLALNGLDGPSHHFVRSDAPDYLNGLPMEPCFDLAVVDPPTFSNSKRTEGLWDVQRDHVTLLNALFPRITPGGVIY
ncbi:MAG: bifunctional 23S rRNA (guanine(2069)-N(7))-methyltransferase RlmK/23S rRNA (guanine(2445)-N(2))-methyltransferase RlmL, partial [Patescibacteria group bacterium]|nr:bifunctional 23S rRNA (guanine(2069)-N(7))-methyltransferase RlmK/23S rRNA (guanine(2445)-N(2))-methyltransferase RlmL [Patescibacteria group bacterium]